MATCSFPSIAVTVSWLFAVPGYASFLRHGNASISDEQYKLYQLYTTEAVQEVAEEQAGKPAWQRLPLRKPVDRYLKIATDDQVDFLMSIVQPVDKNCLQSHNDDKTRPMRQVLHEHGEKDGFCHFKFHTHCSMAARAKDYAAYAVAAAPKALAEYAWKIGYNARNFTSLPGVYAYDALMCYESGFLELPDKIWEDFAGLNSRAANYCNKLRDKVPGLENMTHSDMCSRNKVENQILTAERSYDYAHRKFKMPTQQGIKRHMAWKCDLNPPYGAACDMAYCRYNFCVLPDGRVGQGKQCRSDWMEESFVRRHWEAFRDAAKGATIPQHQYNHSIWERLGWRAQTFAETLMLRTLKHQ